jgi:hypothetical protein
MAIDGILDVYFRHKQIGQLNLRDARSLPHSLGKPMSANLTFHINDA